jgi:hypothetical protein
MKDSEQPTTRVIPSGPRDRSKTCWCSSFARRDLRDCSRIREVPRCLRDSG